MNAITGLNDTEALLLEKFQALLADLDTAGDNAQYGHVLDDMDDYLFLHGRKFLTEILQSKTQERINAADQTDAAKQCPHCKKNGSPQNEDENPHDEQQSHQDFPPSSPLQLLRYILVSRRSAARIRQQLYSRRTSVNRLCRC